MIDLVYLDFLWGVPFDLGAGKLKLMTLREWRVHEFDALNGSQLTRKGLLLLKL